VLELDEEVLAVEIVLAVDEVVLKVLAVEIVLAVDEVVLKVLAVEIVLAVEDVVLIVLAVEDVVLAVLAVDIVLEVEEDDVVLGKAKAYRRTVHLDVADFQTKMSLSCKSVMSTSKSALSFNST
jgi:hypothetical protein